jgi:hypothetical protein
MDNHKQGLPPVPILQDLKKKKFHICTHKIVFDVFCRIDKPQKFTSHNDNYNSIVTFFYNYWSLVKHADEDG